MHEQKRHPSDSERRESRREFLPRVVQRLWQVGRLGEEAARDQDEVRRDEEQEDRARPEAAAHHRRARHREGARRSRDPFHGRPSHPAHRLRELRGV